MSRGVIHQSHLCTLNQFGEGICHADSGGPLVNMKDELVGIVSFNILKELLNELNKITQFK